MSGFEASDLHQGELNAAEPEETDRVIAGRLQEVLGNPAETIAPDLLEAMIRLMKRDMRGGHRFEYDRPDHLRDLYARACARVGQQELNSPGDTL